MREAQDHGVEEEHLLPAQAIRLGTWVLQPMVVGGVGFLDGLG